MLTLWLGQLLPSARFLVSEHHIPLLTCWFVLNLSFLIHLYFTFEKRSNNVLSCSWDVLALNTWWIVEPVWNLHSQCKQISTNCEAIWKIFSLNSVYFCAHGSVLKRNMILEHQKECSFHNNTEHILQFGLLMKAVVGLNFSPLHQVLWGSVVQRGRQWGNPQTTFRVNCPSVLGQEQAGFKMQL